MEKQPIYQPFLALRSLWFMGLGTTMQPLDVLLTTVLL